MVVLITTQTFHSHFELDEKYDWTKKILPGDIYFLYAKK